MELLPDVESVDYVLPAILERISVACNANGGGEDDRAVGAWRRPLRDVRDTESDRLGARAAGDDSDEWRADADHRPGEDGFGSLECLFRCDCRGARARVRGGKALANDQKCTKERRDKNGTISNE